MISPVRAILESGRYNRPPLRGLKVDQIKDPCCPFMRDPVAASNPSFRRKPESILFSQPSSSKGKGKPEAGRSFPRTPESNEDYRPSFRRKPESILFSQPSSSNGKGKPATGRSFVPIPVFKSEVDPSSPQGLTPCRGAESIYTSPAGGADAECSWPSPSFLSARRIALSFLFAILFSLLTATGLAAADGVITGTVVNGTAGGGVPADVAVTLYFLRDGNIVEQRTEVTDSSGAYRFADLPTDTGLGFVVVAAYVQVPYNTPELLFNESTEIQAPPLTVYEASQDVSAVRVITDVLIIAPGEEQSGMLAVIEVVRLANQSDRTFLATGGAGSGAPMDRVLRFALPANAQDLTMISGLNSQSVVQIDRGFGVFMPLLPGEREVAFGYQLPYSGSSLDLIKRTVYPTENFAILVLEEHNLQIESEDLTVQATPIGDRRYVVGSTESLTARAEVKVRVEGLPTPSLQVRLERLFERVSGTQASLFVLLGVVLILPLLYAAYRMRGGLRRKAEPAAAVAPTAPDSGKGLLLEIAQLDDDFAAGSLAEDDYRRQRAELKQRLMDHHEEEGK